MKQCKRIRLLIPAYFDKKLEKDEQKEVEEHVAECAGCAAAFERIKQLVGTLHAVLGVELPKSITDQLAGSTQPVGIHKRGSTYIVRTLAIHRRRLYRIFTNIAILVVIVAITAGFYKILIIGDVASDVASTNASPQQSVTTMKELPVTLLEKPKPKKEEPGVESQDGADKGLTENLPQPQVKVTHTIYQRSDIDEVKFRTVVRDFTFAYTVSQVSQLQEQYTQDIGQGAIQVGENSAELQTCVRTVIERFGKPSLPAYIEKVRYKGKDAWIIVLVWGTGAPDAQLSNITTFVVEPTHNAVMYTG